LTTGTEAIHDPSQASLKLTSKYQESQCEVMGKSNISRHSN